MDGKSGSILLRADFADDDDDVCADGLFLTGDGPVGSARLRFDFARERMASSGYDTKTPKQKQNQRGEG